MRFYLVVCFVAMIFAATACGGDEESGPEAGDTGNTADSADTGDAGDSSDTGGDTGSEEMCGNGSVDAGESCDGNTGKCLDLDESDWYEGGILTCNPDCTWNTDDCYPEENPDDGNTGNTGNTGADTGDTGDTSAGGPECQWPDDYDDGFTGADNTQCAVDRTDVCSKQEYDAWSGMPEPAEVNECVRRMCVAGAWVWAPGQKVSDSASCSSAKNCFPGEVAQFIDLQDYDFGFCVCYNKCVPQDDATAKDAVCGNSRPCVKIDSQDGEVFICGGSE